MICLWYGEGRVGWGGVGGLITSNNVQVYFYTHVMLRYCTFLLHLHTHVMLRYCGFFLHFRTHVMLRYSGWKTSFASFCSSGPWMMIHTKHCKYQIKCSILMDFSRVLRRRVTLFLCMCLNASWCPLGIVVCFQITRIWHQGRFSIAMPKAVMFPISNCLYDNGWCTLMYHIRVSSNKGTPSSHPF